jgi:hypothetical protein
MASSFPPPLPAPSAPPMDSETYRLLYHRQPPSVPPPLPFGWEELKDESGRTYYGNPYLKITQYDRPGNNSLEYLQNQLNFIEKEKTNLSLALLESNLESIVKEVSKIVSKKNEDGCSQQCQIANQSIDSTAIEYYLNKNMNDIFNK